MLDEDMIAGECKMLLKGLELRFMIVILIQDIDLSCMEDQDF